MSTHTASLPTKSTASKPAPAAPSELSVQPYVHFLGCCEKAVEFYRRALGAKVTMLMRYKDAPPCDSACASGMPMPPPEKIMHCGLQIGSTMLLLADGCCPQQKGFDGFSLSLTAPDVASAERAFKALSDGGQVHMALAPTFFAASFGVVQDRFGVSWMIYVPAAPSP